MRRVPLVEPPPSLKKRLIQNNQAFFVFKAFLKFRVKFL
ncbi:Hypothetical protein Ccan_10080 [Capnocytophaga canimorsus Cc5]|uniref:Uncharacterized protein n=1 Tax=Capnocytophaga canimorsus (strain 5) TaxID=860228 RepID=F9YV79_CAPCC|nr:Hypothetical protein Ccan_10080 [Capnocytophaga canimorsus Cc5]